MRLKLGKFFTDFDPGGHARFTAVTTRAEDEEQTIAVTARGDSRFTAFGITRGEFGQFISFAHELRMS